MRTGSNEQTDRRRSIAARVGAVLALAAGMLALGADPARAAGPVDQSQPVAEHTFGDNVRSAQTFTAGVTGLLDQIDVALIRGDDGGSDEPFVVEITEGLYPTGAPLATVSVPASSVPAGPQGDGSYAFVSVPLAPAVPVVAGTVYAVVIERTAPWHVIYAMGAPYSGGAAYNWDPHGGGVPACEGPCWREPLTTFTDYMDQGFHTYVSPPPPPPAAPAGLLSGLLDGLGQQLPLLQPVLSPVSGLLKGLGL